MINKKKVLVAAGSLAVGGVIAAGVVMGNGIAQADSPSPNPSGAASAGPRGEHGEGPGRGGSGGAHTEVTGDELAKVTAAVKAKDAAVTVEKVLKDEDGSYDVLGTKAGAPVRLEASSDLKTISAAEAGPGLGRGKHGGPDRGTEVTGAELAKVTAAVKAKDSAVTVEKVFKKADGSYHVDGTKAGARVHVEASADLKTISAAEAAPEPGKGGPRGAHTEVTGAELTKVTAAVKAKDSAVTVEKVLRDDDGSYDVMGTKAGAKVRVEVSSDLKTIEVKTGR